MFDYRMEAGNPARLGVTKNGKDINFAVVVRDGKDCSLLLYKKGQQKIAAELPFTEKMRFGDIYALQIENFPVKEYEYNYRIDYDASQYRLVTHVGQETLGVEFTFGEVFKKTKEGESAE